MQYAVLSRLPSQGYHTVNQRSPLPGLQLRTTSWPRQLSTRLHSLLCLMMGLKSWRIYECWWLPSFLISNKTWKGLRILFGHFLRNTYYICIVLYAQLFLYQLRRTTPPHFACTSESCCIPTTVTTASMTDKNCKCRDVPYDKECSKDIVDVSWAIDKLFSYFLNPTNFYRHKHGQYCISIVNMTIPTRHGCHDQPHSNTARINEGFYRHGRLASFSLIFFLVLFSFINFLEAIDLWHWCHVRRKTLTNKCASGLSFSIFSLYDNLSC